MRTAHWTPLLLGALCLSPMAARADVPPPDSCSTVGQACQNAVDGGATGLPGTCQATQCTRATPAGPVTYACNRCAPGPSQTPSQETSCSCSVPGQSRPRSRTTLALAALALAAVCTSQRSRR
ncbi:MAG: hypothetical protein KA978_12325 [Deltaproteobacteria bacterium]|nr:hypothetical protein [Deltaproteobacteria bacterium]